MEVLHVTQIKTIQDMYRPGAVFYQDPATKQAFRRVVGGLAWPYDIRPGALVVLVEHSQPMPGQDQHRVDVAAEFTDEDPEQILRRASLWGETLSCRAWHTPLAAPELRLVQDYNDGRRRLRLPLLDCSNPPSVNGSRDWNAYHRLLERRTRSAKTLFFGEESQAAREYKVRQRTDVERRLEMFPLLAAFLWALAALDLESGSVAARPGGHRTGRGHGPADKLGGY